MGMATASWYPNATVSGASPATLLVAMMMVKSFSSTVATFSQMVRNGLPMKDTATPNRVDANVVRMNASATKEARRMLSTTMYTEIRMQTPMAICHHRIGL